MATLDDLIRALEELRRRWLERGYNFNGFWHMVEARGHVGAVTAVVAGTHIPDGYRVLWQRGDLALSVEALIADGRFDDVLGRTVKNDARHRLRQFGHRVPPRVVP